MPIQPLILSHYTVSNALGHGKQASLTALQQQRGGLKACDFAGADIATFIGEVPDVTQVTLPSALQAFHCRNNQLALLALQQDEFAVQVQRAKSRYAADRIGVFIGTSTSGIGATEYAYQHRVQGAVGMEFATPYDFMHTHNIFSVADFVQQYFQLNGPAHAISTACSSSSKVFAAAYRHMQAGLCDAAIVGGVDSLCLTTLYGFNSLQLVSTGVCRPWDENRNGINIGEAAGFALLEYPGRSDSDSELALLGYGESSDAWHMSSPHPQGHGAQQAMQLALDSAGLVVNEIDYINLHGTATKSNDAAEDAAVSNLFGSRTPCSSTKGWTGHTLGAAGIVEAAFSCMALERQFIPGSLNTHTVDPALSANINLQSRAAAVNTVLSNSFGFGGTNCSLVLGKWQVAKK